MSIIYTSAYSLNERWVLSSLTSFGHIIYRPLAQQKKNNYLCNSFMEFYWLIWVVPLILTLTPYTNQKQIADILKNLTKHLLYSPTMR